MFQCLEEWLKYCWPIWKLSSDYKMISALLKVLLTSKDSEIATHIQKLLITLICLCKTDEQKQIIANLDKANEIQNTEFNLRIEAIKQEINV